MTAYLVAVHLLLDVDQKAQREIADALNTIFTEKMRTYSVVPSRLIDWAVTGSDLASSIIKVDLPDDYVPGETSFPTWPARRTRVRRQVTARTMKNESPEGLMPDGSRLPWDERLRTVGALLVESGE